jgi:DNA-binding protein HU-beta
VTKQELIEKVADTADLSKTQAADVLDCIVASIGDALAGGDKVSLIGFGTFETRERAAREGRNPQTKETIQIAAKTVPVFRAGKALRDKVA